VIKRIGLLVLLRRRSMQAEMRVILEETSRRAEALETEDNGGLVFVSIQSTREYSREEIYDDAW
jgi:hypothetical protein